MPRSGSRPGGTNRPSRSRRPGRAGKGPGPAYQPSRGGSGTPHRSSSATRRQALAAAMLFLVLPVVAVVGLASFLLHGYGVL